MNYGYELIEHNYGLPFKIFINYASEIPYHWHNDMEILLVLKGRVNVLIDNTENHLKEDDLIIINRNCLHNTIIDYAEPAVIAGIQINIFHFDTYIEDFSQKDFLCKSFLHGKYYQQKINPIRSAIARILLEYSVSGNKSMFAIWGIINLLCHYINKNIEYKNHDKQKKYSSKEEFERLIRIMEYIKKHANEKITLEKIAQMEHINKYYLSHFFKTNIGIGFKSYIQNVRLDYALQQILSNENSITEIASMCGFPSLNSFYKLFKEKYHCLPTVFKDTYIKFENNRSSSTPYGRYVEGKLKSYLQYKNSSLDYLIGKDYNNKHYSFGSLVHQSE